MASSTELSISPDSAFVQPKVTNKCRKKKREELSDKDFDDFAKCSKSSKIKNTDDIFTLPLIDEANVLFWIQYMNKNGVPDYISISKLFKFKFMELKKCKNLLKIKCSKDYSYFFNMVDNYDSPTIVNDIYLFDNVYLAKLLGITLDNYLCILYDCIELYKGFSPQILIQLVVKVDAHKILIEMCKKMYVDVAILYKQCMENKSIKCIITLMRENTHLSSEVISFICTSHSASLFAGYLSEENLKRCIKECKDKKHASIHFFNTIYANKYDEK